MADVLGEILPPQVAAVEAFDDPPDVPLYPEEEALLSRAVARRRQEFSTTRWCARQALAKLGLPPAAILPGPRRAPRWPDGVVGSLTHCAGYRAAALAHARDVAAIGIDAEPHEPLPDGVRDVIVGREETPALAELTTAEPGTSWDKLLFSAKESVYKAWFPLTGRWLGFKDVAVSIDPGGTFTVRVLVPGAMLDGRELNEFSGRWVARNGLVITSVTVPGPGGQSGGTGPTGPTTGRTNRQGTVTG